MFKFGWLPDGKHDQEFLYPNAFAFEQTSGPQRIVIAPRADPISIMERLIKPLKEPFLLLYVLVLSRIESEPARYQAPTPLTREALDSFLTKYRRFLELDGRHNLWVLSDDETTIIYDRHNLIYTYGNLSHIEQQLIAMGLTQLPTIHVPDPHSHHYHAEFDQDQTSLLADFQWLKSPLRIGDASPGE